MEFYVFLQINYKAPKRFHWQPGYCRRDSNQIAEQLAKLYPPLLTIFKNSPPTHVLRSYLQECNSQSELFEEHLQGCKWVFNSLITRKL